MSRLGRRRVSFQLAHVNVLTLWTEDLGALLVFDLRQASVPHHVAISRKLTSGLLAPSEQVRKQWRRWGEEGEKERSRSSNTAFWGSDIPSLLLYSLR